MPTADILATGQDRVEYESSGSGKFYVPEGGSLFGTQTGLILGFEAGVDNATQNTTVYNVKWRFWGEGAMMPALAVGVQNVRMGDETQSYAVATKSLVPSGALQVSFGGIHLAGETLTMLGGQARLGAITVKADTASGGMLARCSGQRRVFH